MSGALHAIHAEVRLGDRRAATGPSRGSSSGRGTRRGGAAGSWCRRRRRRRPRGPPRPRPRPRRRRRRCGPSGWCRGRPRRRRGPPRPRPRPRRRRRRAFRGLARTSGPGPSSPSSSSRTSSIGSVSMTSSSSSRTSSSSTIGVVADLVVVDLELFVVFELVFRVVGEVGLVVGHAGLLQRGVCGGRRDDRGSSPRRHPPCRPQMVDSGRGTGRGRPIVPGRCRRFPGPVEAFQGPDRPRDQRSLLSRPARRTGNGFMAAPLSGCTSKWRWGRPPAALPVLPT